MSIQQTIVSTATSTLRYRASLRVDKLKRYRNACDSLPALLRQCGLTQTLAYLLTSTDETALLAEDLQTHFHELLGVGEHALLSYLQGRTVAEYRLMSDLANQIAAWHKRLAKAMLPTP